MKTLKHSLCMALCIIASACSSPPKSMAPPQIERESSSSFEISYWLGEHGEHRLSGSTSQTSGTHVVSYLNTEVVDERQVKTESYSKYLAKLQSFIKSAQRTPSQESECRTPFTVVLKIDGITHTSKGCRASDEASFSRLIRDGEFLLYSKK
jgi:hypothetical protein